MKINFAKCCNVSATHYTVMYISKIERWTDRWTNYLCMSLKTLLDSCYWALLPPLNVPIMTLFNQMEIKDFAKVFFQMFSEAFKCLSNDSTALQLMMHGTCIRGLLTLLSFLNLKACTWLFIFTCRFPKGLGYSTEWMQLYLPAVH